MRIDSTNGSARPVCRETVEPRTEPALPFSRVLRPEVRTPLSEQDAFRELALAWQRVTGTEAPPRAVSILWAQWAMETARGTRMYGHNFSGIKGTGPSGLSLMLRTSEGYGANRRDIRDRFRAYVSPAEGATDYVRLLNDRYPEALVAASRGDARGFVHEIRRRGYFTDEETKYANAVHSLAGEAARSHGGEPLPEAEPPVRLSPVASERALEALRWASRRWEE